MTRSSIRCEIKNRKAGVREAEFKIELPGGYPWWEAALSIRKSEPELNDLEEVHIAAQRLVVILGGTLEIANRSRYDPWEFSVLQELMAA